MNTAEMEIKQDLVANGQTEVTISKPGKVVHCSDGIIEDIEEDKVDQVESAPKVEENVDPKTLPWGPWFSHYAWKSGNKVLKAVDTAGESLAYFFGITTPKYQIEIDEYERLQAEKRKMEEDSAGWVPKNGGGDVPLVLNEPLSVLKDPSNSKA